MGEESCSFWTRTYGSHAPWNMAPDHLHCHWWQCFKRRMCYLSSSASMTWILQPFKLEVPVHSLHDQADLSHCLTFIWTHNCASHSLISYSAFHRAATEWFHLITHWFYSTAPFPFSKCGSHLAKPWPLLRTPCKMMLQKCYTQYARKNGKFSSGHKTGKGQFSFQSQRKAMPKSAQATTQLTHFTC